MATQNKIEKITAKEQQLPQSTNQQKPITSLPPSPSSSPSHEFSFTISLHPSQPSITDKRKAPPSIAIDLSPADEIFFHGHLLPLHLLSHLSNSPRLSTTSVDNLSPTIRELFDNPQLNNSNNDTTTNTTTTTTTTTNTNTSASSSGPKVSNKTNSFSLFKLAKWRKALETSEATENKKKLRFNVRRVLRRYVRVVRPFLFFRGQKERREFRRQPHSFSGSLSFSSKWKEWGGRRRGGFSAPASMHTSPTNSGLLVATATITSSKDSTMEELQNAIQAAIAHCKDSIATKEEKCNS